MLMPIETEKNTNLSLFLCDAVKCMMRLNL